MAVFALAAPVLAGCGGDGAKTSCSLTACTVTFDRGSDAKVSVLGVEAKLVSVQGDQVTVSVADQQVTVPVNQTADAGGFTVGVQSVTADQVVVQISKS